MERVSSFHRILSMLLDASERRPWVTCVILICLHLALSLPKLGDSYLWQDEAETALLGRSVLHHGIPLAHDGLNVISQQSGTDYREGYVWIWHSWLQYYGVAASFALLGESAFSARLPFVFFGSLCVAALFLYGRRVSSTRGAPLLASVLFLLSVPFLLHTRQCRWYTLSVFFFLLSLIAYDRCMSEKRHSRLFFFLAMTGLFHSYYPAALFAAAGFFVHAALFRKGQARWKDLAWIVALLLSAIPWAIYTKVWARGEFRGMWQVLMFAKWYLLALNDVAVPFVLLPLWAFLIKKSRGHAWALFFLLLVIMISLSSYPRSRLDAMALFILLPVGIGTLLLLTFKKTPEDPDHRSIGMLHALLVAAILLPLPWLPRNNVRYILTLLPLAALFEAELLIRLWQRIPVGSALLTGLLLFSNLLSWTPLMILRSATPKALIPDPRPDLPFPSYEAGVSTGPRCLLLSYANELTHEYVGPLEVLVPFLKAHAKPGDVVLTNYDDLSIMFYTGLKVLGGLNDTGWDEKNVQWIIPRRFWRNREILIEKAAAQGLQPIRLPVKDLLWENREFTAYHLFRSIPPATEEEKLLVFGLRIADWVHSP